MEVLEDGLRVLLKQGVLRVFEKGVVEAKVTRVVAERGEVQRHHLDVIEHAVGHTLMQMVRRGEDILRDRRRGGRSASG